MNKFISHLNDWIKSFSSSYLERPLSLKQLQLGFDMGQESLKFSMVEQGRSKIAGLWHSEIFPDREDKDQVMGEDSLCARLKAITTELKDKLPHFSMESNGVIQGEWTVNQYLELPVLSKKELDLAVEAKAMKNIPFGADQINLDYIQVPPVSGDSKKTGVFVAAAHREVLEKYKNFLNGCGLKIQRLETTVMPLAREFSHNHRDMGNGCFLIIHSGYRITHLLIIKNGFPYYAREFNLAGRDFTYAFQMAFQTTWAQAEKYKTDYDALRRDPTIEPFISRWLDEVKRSIRFFSDSFADADLKIEKIFISGGTAGMRNLDRLLSSHLSIPVELDRWESIKVASEAKELDPWLFKVAAGLAL